MRELDGPNQELPGRKNNDAVKYIMLGWEISTVSHHCGVHGVPVPW